jgi:hypothetical protein
MTHGRIVYGPDWPDPADVAEFLQQVLQFTRASIADGRPFQPQRAVVLLIDDRDGGYELADVCHNIVNTEAIAALAVSSRRFARALDPDGVFNPEG